jgi:hypothetical protein
MLSQKNCALNNHFAEGDRAMAKVQSVTAQIISTRLLG